MPVVDLHNHMIAPDVLAFLEREGERFATRIVERDGARFFLIKETALRPINARVTQAEARLPDMEAEGIDVEAVSCIPFAMYPDVSPDLGLALAQVNNDALAALARRDPEHFSPLASVPIQAPELAARELERAAGLGLRGVMIPPNVQGQGLDEPKFEVFWAAAESLRMLVCLHPFDAAPTGPFARYALGNLVGNLFDTGLAAALLINGGVLERHPGLRVVLYHAGGALPSLIGRLDAGYSFMPASRTAISRLPSTYFNQLWFDCIAFNPALLRYLASTYGAERLVIGTDYPLDARVVQPVAMIEGLGLGDAAERAILADNASGLLGLSAAGD